MKRATLLAALALLACSGVRAGSIEVPLQIGGAFSVPATSLKEARFRATVRQQYDYSCGSAALSTLLTHHYRYAVNEQQVFEEMFQRGDREKIRREGFSLLDMKRYLDAHGFEADGFEAPLQELASASIPAIVLVNESGYNHFVVVKGLRNGRVLIGDPAGGTRSLSLSDFQAIWVSRILFIIGNQREGALFNVATDWSAAPQAPIGGGIDRNGLSGIVLPRLGPSDF